MQFVLIDNKAYPVVENLGYQPGVGMRAKVVRTETGERVAVKRKNGWHWWTAADRLQARGRLVGQDHAV